MIERSELLTARASELGKRIAGTDFRAYSDGPWIVQPLMVNVVEHPATRSGVGHLAQGTA